MYMHFILGFGCSMGQLWSENGTFVMEKNILPKSSLATPPTPNAFRSVIFFANKDEAKDSLS